MKNIIGGTLTVALAIGLTLALVGSFTSRLNLIVVHPAFWPIALGAVLILGGGWLKTAEMHAGNFFLSAGVLSCALGGYRVTFPNIAEATTYAKSVLEERLAQEIRNSVAPRIIPCDRMTKPPFGFFDQAKRPIVWVAYDEKTSRILCRDREGFDSITQQQFVAVTLDLVRDIMSQDPPPTPTPAPVVITAQVLTPKIAPTPLPILDEEPIR